MAIMNPYNYMKPKNFIRVEADRSLKAVPTAKDRGNGVTDSYLESRVLSAKPEELTFMLYEGMVKFIKKAGIALEGAQYERVNENIQRAQAIVDELRSTLNMDIPLSESLDALYEYLGYKLLTANLEKSASELQDALDIAEDFKTTWQEAFGIR